MVEYGTWKPSQIGNRTGLKLSHICFADDPVFIAYASFLRTSSYDKKNLIYESEVFFTKNLQNDMASKC